MKLGHVFAILAVTILIGFTGTFFVHSFYNYYEVRELDMVLEVAPKLGFNTETDKLNFGSNFPGNTCKKFMNVSFPKEAKVVIDFEGDLADWVTVNEKQFTLKPDEVKNLEFLASIPKDIDLGIYTGKVKFYFKRP
jgi:hypothetical protein